MNRHQSSSPLEPRVSVVMPTFNQARFITRGLEGLLAQTLGDWELIIVDDGSTDDTHAVVQRYLDDPRISYYRAERNIGMGAALNRGLDFSNGSYVAYLPSDDYYFPNHLESLAAALDGKPAAVVAYSGLRYWQNHSTPGQRDGEPLQLVQVMHRPTGARWTERSELVTDDLDAMFWSKLRRDGVFVATRQVSCEWVDHPGQRHKAVRETLGGGLNVYRTRYRPSEPLRYHSTVGNAIDEVELYRRFRERRDDPAQDGLTILLVGELAYNPERVLALAERGHRLYGLWTDQPYWFSSVGPQPFGHVRDLPRDGWQDAVRKLRPDVIYGLLNWQAVPFVHQVLTDNPGIPFVWHLKESPQHCLAEGRWPQLVDLHLRSDGQIYSSPELRDWFAAVVPDTASSEHTFVLDGDLPKREWFEPPASRRLSLDDGEVHTVVPGRLMGIEPAMVGALARRGIHLHFYGTIFQSGSRSWIDEARRLAGDRLHLHPGVDQRSWVSEFSRYDAGWLHLFHSENGGDIRLAKWDDLNYPARIATLMCAGVPLIQQRQPGGLVASEVLARRHRLGVTFSDVDDLARQLHDSATMGTLRDSVGRQREHFSFDHHADALVSFFRGVIAAREGTRVPRPRTRALVLER